eukprot:5289069-Prymnesium_polylepis.1
MLLPFSAVALAYALSAGPISAPIAPFRSHMIVASAAADAAPLSGASADVAPLSATPAVATAPVPAERLIVEPATSLVAETVQ